VKVFCPTGKETRDEYITQRSDTVRSVILFLNPHIAGSMKSKKVSAKTPPSAALQAVPGGGVRI
jgi:hypothetical protein